eukprot:TRINITY_DN29325_c0_g1_i1.p1 TRINITY_DN29325_c0_g1~~TRINITY_DN29325_c0_g1_i1.p1  ORF type:complete len:644 (+),score=146.85 TRINITY_DN29325_c0_g1_i1:157-1932(+)
MWRGGDETRELFAFSTNNKRLSNGLAWALKNEEIEVEVASFNSTSVVVKISIEGYRADMEETIRIGISPKAFLSGHMPADMGSAQIVVEAAKVKTIVGGAGIIAALSSQPQGAQQIALLLDLECGNGTVSKLPRSMNPFGLPLDHDDCLGAIAYNTGLVGAAFLLHFLLALLARQLTSSNPNLAPAYWLPIASVKAAQGLVRFPGGAIYVFLFFYQGMAKCGWVLVFTGASTTAWFIVVGLVTVAVLVAIPVYVAYVLREAVQNHVIRYREEDVPMSPWLAFMVAKGEWVSRSRNDPANFRYSLQLRAFAPACAWYLLQDFAMMMGIGILTAIPAETYQQCGHIRVGLSGVCLIGCGVEVWKRPHIRMRDNVCDFVRLLLQAAGLLCAAIGYYSENMAHPSIGVAAIFFMCALIVLMIKVVMDVATELYVFCKGRRTRLQRDEWGEWDMNMAEGVEEMLQVKSVSESSETEGDGDGVVMLKPSRRERTWSGLVTDLAIRSPGTPDEGSLDLECPLISKKSFLSWEMLKDDVGNASIPINLAQSPTPDVSLESNNFNPLPAPPASSVTSSVSPAPSPRHQRRRKNISGAVTV